MFALSITLINGKTHWPSSPPIGLNLVVCLTVYEFLKVFFLFLIQLIIKSKRGWTRLQRWVPTNNTELLCLLPKLSEGMHYCIRLDLSAAFDMPDHAYLLLIWKVSFKCLLTSHHMLPRSLTCTSWKRISFFALDSCCMYPIIYFVSFISRVVYCFEYKKWNNYEADFIQITKVIELPGFWNYVKLRVFCLDTELLWNYLGLQGPKKLAALNQRKQFYRQIEKMLGDR